MENLFATFEEIFWELWNKLYEFLCELMGGEVNPDWMAPLPEGE